MKRLLLAASVCAGLFAFTKVGTSRDRHAVAGNSFSPNVTDMAIGDTSHKPDSARSISYFQTDTTKKPDSARSVSFLQPDTSHKPKPDSMSLAMVMLPEGQR